MLFMKIFIALVLLFCGFLTNSQTAQAQTFQRLNNESLDNLIKRTTSEPLFLDDYYIITHNNFDVILYAESQYLNNGDSTSNPLESLFTALIAVIQRNEIDYEKIVLDTLGYYGSCWMNPQLDTICIIEEKYSKPSSLIAVVGHEPFCDALIPYSQIKVYDFIQSKEDASTFEIKYKFSSDNIALPTPPTKDIIKKTFDKLE
jgi:hypothetical protein